MIASSNIQIDGRHSVREQHTDDSGNLYYLDYMAEKGTNLNQHLSNNATQLNASFKFLSDNAIPIAQAQIAFIQSQINSLQTNLTAKQNVVTQLQVAQSVSL